MTTSLPLSLAVNLVYNDGSEEVSNGAAAYWAANRTLGTGDSIGPDSSNVPSDGTGGHYSINITSGNTAGLGAKQTYCVPITPGASFNVSATIETQNAKSGAYINVPWYDKNYASAGRPGAIYCRATRQVPQLGSSL